MRLPLALFSLAYAWLTRRAWRHYDRVFADSNEVRSRILRGRLCAPETVEVLHPGVDAAAIRPSFTHDRSFLYAGRIKWTKNVELAIDAFLAFRARTADTGAWRLVIAGGVDDGTVTFVANPSDAELGALYARCCALIFPSLNEDWGIVPLEAMAHGKPVLAVNRGGPAESVMHGETGFLLEPTPQAFAAQLDWLACHPAETERLGRRAAERAASFSWDRFVTRLDDYFERDR
jgi:glycosyltransferase involved in cell wall biosynthesis